MTIRRNHRWWLWLLLFLIAFASKLVLIQQNHTLYSYDAFTRVWERDALIVRHWLPVPQLPVFIGAHLFDSLFLMRLLCAAAGSLAAVTMGLAVAKHVEERSGFVYGAFLAFLPSYVVHTIVPYQEGFSMLFCGLALFGWPAADGEQQKVPWWVSVSLVLAVLSRYEPWLLAFVLFAWSVRKKEYSRVYACLPAIITMALWSITGNWLPSAEGPTRPFAGDAFGLAEQLSNPSRFVAMLLPFSKALLIGILQSITPAGWVLLPWGIYQACRKKHLFGREIIIFAIIVVALSLLRMINVQAVTGRIFMMPVLWLLPFVAFGLVDIASRLRSQFVSGLLILAVTAFICWSYGSSIPRIVRQSAEAWEPEARATLLLLKLPKNVPVEIRARFDKRWNESTIGGIFAQSLDLDPEDPRWSYPGKPASISNQPRMRLIWQGSQYELETIQR